MHIPAPNGFSGSRGPDQREVGRAGDHQRGDRRVDGLAQVRQPEADPGVLRPALLAEQDRGRADLQDRTTRPLAPPYGLHTALLKVESYSGSGSSGPPRRTGTCTPPPPGRNRPSQPGGSRAGRKALRIRYINGMEVRKMRPRGVQERGPGGSSEPPGPLAVSPCLPRWSGAARPCGRAPSRGRVCH
jgi:hypothetical protein